MHDQIEEILGIRQRLLIVYDVNADSAAQARGVQWRSQPGGLLRARHGDDDVELAVSRERVD
jgi:hypothetical protein